MGALMHNFNELKLQDAQIAHGQAQKDHSASNGVVAVHFKNLETALVKYIQGAQAVVGCVAWLTSEPVLKALSKVSGGVAIVVEKETYLRKDDAAGKYWLEARRELYKKVRDGPWMPASFIGGAMSKMRSGPNFSRSDDLAAYGSDEELVDPIRCMGQKTVQSGARMHNKFLVFCKSDTNARLLPYAVWTGSFNFSKTATLSFENAVLISDSVIAEAYLREFSQISALGETLEWKTDYVSPNLKIGDR